MPLKPRALPKRKPLVRKPDEFTTAEEAAQEVDKPLEVEDGPELLRILGLERRDIPDPEGEDAVRVAAFLTRTLGKLPPEQLYPGPLMPTQGLALREGKMNKGGFFPIVVGGGKMLTCYLMAALHIAAGFERVMYVVPGANMPDVLREFPLYEQSWNGPSVRQLQIKSYEIFSNKANAEEVDAKGKVIKLGLLDRLRPQVIILDESHSAANPSAAITLRLRHYMRRNPDTIVFAFSGTPFIESIRDCAHVLEWCLKERSPLPRMSHFLELHSWAGYLDAKSGALGRVKLGQLRQLAEQYDYEPDIWTDEVEVQEEILHEMRRVVARRILETPGVIGTQDAPLDIPLTMEPWLPVVEDPAVEEAYADIVQDEELPDGTKLADELTTTRHLSTLGYAFWQKWVPAPPAEYVLARNEWGKWCRRCLKYNKHRLTSEATVVAALGRGLYKSGVPVLARWQAAKAAYLKETGLKEPPSQSQWVGFGSEVVESTRAWVKEHHGLVWVKHIQLGELLSRELRVPYYGAGGGKDVATGRNILSHPGGAAIASIDACGTGKNLQRLWSRNLWLCTPGEQSLARTHRKGQTAGVVRNFYYLGCAPHLDSIERARDTKATFQEDMLLSPQKLKYAVWTLPHHWDLERRGGTRWEPRP